MSIIIDYLNERKKWADAGSTIRSKERIEELFNICQSCDKYIKIKENRGKCGVCGCYLTNRENATFNKLAFSTTRCPLEEPKWVEESGYENIKIKPEEIKIEEPTPEQIQPPSPPKRGGCGCRH